MHLPPSFYWHYLQRRYAKALACIDRPEAPRGSKELWALYRLGLYPSVARSERLDSRPQGTFAQAVSSAACGAMPVAEQAARAFAQDCPHQGPRTQLADALAPFIPEYALGLLDGVEEAVCLRAALLLRLGAREQALRLIEREQAASPARAPELHLLRSNADPGAPLQQLTRLNDFLAAHGLPPLALRDPARPPAPANLVPAVRSSPVHGPLVTVLMTAYNAESSIGSAIESILMQSYRDLELLVIDDASQDATGDVVSSWSLRDARVRHIRLPCNVGTYAAKNLGLRQAHGEFVTCHDSDDWSHPEKIARQVAPLLTYRHLIVTTSDWVRIQEDGLFYARPVHPLMRMNPSSPLFRRQAVVDRIGAWDWVRTGADSEFLARLRLGFGRLSMRRITQPLALGAHRPNSLVTSAETGFGDHGIHPRRLSYWESWGHWHIDELRAGRLPHMVDDPLAPRPFDVPAATIAASNHLARSLRFDA